MVIIDTTVWVDYLKGTVTPEVEWLERELANQRFGLTDVPSDTQAPRVKRALEQFEIFETGGVGLALAAAANYRALRSRGRTVRKTIDCLIATFCLLGDYALLHADRDFDPFEQHLALRVVHPSG